MSANRKNKRDVIPIVILSTADMDAVVWTNKQHIASRLADNHEVHFVESLGLREPKFNKSDISRILRRIILIFWKVKKDNPSERFNKNSVKIYRPKVIPFHRFPVVRYINSIIVKLTIIKKLPNDYVLWTFSPLTYHLEVNARRVFYHSVDLLHSIPGISRYTLIAAEKELIKISDATIASSNGVAAHLRSLGGKPLLWENVADIELFKSSHSDHRERRAIFVGNLTPSKVNFDILEDVISLGISLVLAGPKAVDGTPEDPRLSRLLRSPLVSYLGVLTQRQMATELGKSWVGLVPYYDNNYTAGVFPMKIFEYLASGLRVISTPLHSLESKRIEGLEIVEDSNFASCVHAACNSDSFHQSENLDDNSWTYRLKQIEDLIFGNIPNDK